MDLPIHTGGSAAASIPNRMPRTYVAAGEESRRAGTRRWILIHGLAPSALRAGGLARGHISLLNVFGMHTECEFDSESEFDSDTDSDPDPNPDPDSSDL